MPIQLDYPIVMVHPHNSPAVNGMGPGEGRPERFPKVTVNNVDQEEQYRAQGYLRFGEPPKAGIDFHEYPKILRHKDHVPAKPSSAEPVIQDGKFTGQFITIPSIPAQFPDVTVKSREEEDEWATKGWHPAGHYDAQALETALLNADLEDDDEEPYVHQEYPKWVDGKLIPHDPAKPPRKVLSEYPKLVGGKLVTDPNDPQVPDPNRYPSWVHRNGKPGPESTLVKDAPAEFAVLKKWKDEDERKAKEDEGMVEEHPHHPAPQRRVTR